MKLPDPIEDEIEAALDTPAVDAVVPGEVRTLEGARDRYLTHLAGAALAPLDGMRVVVDCANGSASIAAPALLARLGAEVTALNAEPDGVNINDGCGHCIRSSWPSRCGWAPTPVAHDGDADRALFASRRLGGRRGPGARCVCHRDARGRRAHRRYGRRHRHVERQARAGDAGPRHPRCAQRSATGTSWRRWSAPGSCSAGSRVGT
jgi:hypothetical protein